MSKLTGQGARPFEAATNVRLELLESKAFDAGVTFLRHKPVSACAS